MRQRAQYGRKVHSHTAEKTGGAKSAVDILPVPLGSCNKLRSSPGLLPMDESTLPRLRRTIRCSGGRDLIGDDKALRAGSIRARKSPCFLTGGVPRNGR